MFPSSDIAKYRQIFNSNIKNSDNYRQIVSRFMTYSIEFQMLSKDATSKTKTKESKTQINIVKKKMSCICYSRKKSTRQKLFICISMKKVKMNVRISTCAKMNGKKLKRNWNL